MSTVIKLIIKNIATKKTRTFLILFSIVLSASVFFSSIAISGSVLETVLSSVTQVVGISDITIMPKEKSNSPFVYTSGLNKYLQDIESVYGEMDKQAAFTGGNGEKLVVGLKGAALDELKQMNPFKVLNSKNLYPFEGSKVIIGEDIASKYKLSVGDTFNFTIGNSKYRYSICAIAAKGPFSKAYTTKNIVLPKETLNSILGSQGKENALFIKLKDSGKRKEMVKLLSKEYDTYEVKETFNAEKLEMQLAEISSIFFLISGIVFFMSAFIIYSSFKVIAAERIPVIGTLRSIGATKNMTSFILLGESAVYGAIGGILGCALGIGMLYIISLFMSDIANVAPGLELNTTINFTFLHLIFTFLMAFVLSFVSSLIPIIMVAKISIKDIVLKITHISKKKGVWATVSGIMFIIISFLITIPHYNPDDNIFLGLSVLFALMALVLLIPYSVEFFVKAFEKVYVLIFGNIGVIAAKNLRENKSIVNNIIMLSIGVSVLLTINTSGYNSVLSTLNSYKKASYDMRMLVSSGGKDIKNRILNTDGIQDIYEDYEYDNIKVINSDVTIGTIKGVDITKFTRFWDVDLEDAKLIEELDSGRNILLGSSLKRSLKVDKGDTIVLKMKSGQKEYNVIGFFKSFMNNSDYALASSRFLKSDMQAGDSPVFYIKADKLSKELLTKLQDDFKSINPRIQTKKQLEQIEIDDNKNTVLLMQCFCIIAIVIGFFGVVNNLLLNFIQRKQSLAVLRSVGMSKKQTVAMIFIESLTGGVIGGLSGMAGGMAMVYILSKIDDTGLIFEIGSFWTYIAIGVAIMIIASIGPVINSAKLSLIESIKFE